MKNDKNIGRGRPREHPKDTSGRACALPYFPGEALRGHMTPHNVISGQKTPEQGEISYFRFRMRTSHPSTESRDV